MATLTVRNLSEQARAALKVRAAKNNRSMEAEVRAILEDAARGNAGFVTNWLDQARELRGIDFVPPDRSPAREVDLG